VTPVIESVQSGGNSICVVGSGANIGMVNNYLKHCVKQLSLKHNISMEETLSKVKEAYIVEKDTLMFRKDFKPDSNTF